MCSLLRAISLIAVVSTLCEAVLVPPSSIPTSYSSIVRGDGSRYGYSIAHAPYPYGGVDGESFPHGYGGLPSYAPDYSYSVVPSPLELGVVPAQPYRLNPYHEFNLVPSHELSLESPYSYGSHYGYNQPAYEPLPYEPFLHEQYYPIYQNQYKK